MVVDSVIFVLDVGLRDINNGGDKMKRWIKRIAIVLMVVTLILPSSIVLANWLSSPAVIVNDLAIGVNPSSVYGMCFEPNKQTFYANGRHWIFYDNNDSDLVYKTALTNGQFGAETELVATSGLYGWEFGVWYDEPTNTVHMARHNMTPNPDEVQYRMGTPNANGTITWAAVWQTVSTVPATLNNWRTFITVDELGYPWVGWIDTDGVNDYACLFVESSSTKNGTWAEDEAQRFGSGGIATDGTGTMTGSPVYLDIGANTPTVTVAGTFNIEIPIGGSGTAATGGWTVTNSPVALVEGTNEITVEIGGAGTITLTMSLNEWTWFGSITPVGVDDDVVEVQWSSENIATDDVGLYASVFDTDANTWSTRDTVVTEGSMLETRWDGFSFFDVGSSMWVVYTDVTGDVYSRVRSSIQTWGTAGAASKRIDELGDPWLPTISGYQVAPSGLGLDMICIVHDVLDLKYSIYSFDTSSWSDWNLIWSVPDIANDLISRHIASYTYGSPLSFAWQWTDDSEATDTINYWWIDQDQLGYYAGGLSATAVPLADSVPLVFLAMGVLVIIGLSLSDNLNVKMMVFMAIGIMLILAFLANMNSMVNSF
jgi:hypothetical protein